MPIEVTCTCGQSLRAKDEVVGKVVKCPRCGNKFRVEAPSAAEVAAAPPDPSPADRPQPAPAQGGDGFQEALNEWGPSTSAASGGKLKLIVGLGVVLVAAGGAFFLLRSKGGAEKAPSATAAVESSQERAAEAKTEDESASDEPTTEAPASAAEPAESVPQEPTEKAARKAPSESPLGNAALGKKTASYYEKMSKPPVRFLSDEEVRALGLPFKRLAASDNAAVLYLEAMAKVEPIPRSQSKVCMTVINDGWKADRPDMERLLEANGDSLLLTKDGGAKAECQFPLACLSDAQTVTAFPLVLPHLARARSLARLMALDARRQQAQGEPEATMACTLAAYRLGCHIRDNGTLISALVGIAIDSIAAPVALQLLQSGELTGPQCAQFATMMWEIHSRHTPLQTALESEKLTGLDCLKDASTLRNMARAIKPLAPLAEAIPPDGPGAQAFVAAIRAELGSQYDQMIADLANDRVQAFEDRMKQLRSDAKADAEALREQPALAGRMMAGIFMPGLRRSLTAFREDQVRMRALAIVAGLQSYRGKHRKWPESLDDLVRDYLPEVPVDPFDKEKKPFCYQLTKAGLRFYSVGPDRTDDGAKSNYQIIPAPGRKTKQDPKGRDIVFTLP